MGATSGLLVGAMTSMSSAYSESQALRSQGEYQKRIADMNTRLSEIQGEDAIKRGDKAAIDIKKQGKQVIGAQRASMAAQGIELDSGSALDVQADTAAISQLDAMTVRNNAWREAWGYKIQAMDTSFRGTFAQIEANTRARQTLLTGGIKAINQGAQAAQGTQAVQGGVNAIAKK